MERKRPVAAIQVESGKATDVGDSTLRGRLSGRGRGPADISRLDIRSEFGSLRARILGLSLLMGINVVVITYDVRSHLVATVIC